MPRDEHSITFFRFAEHTAWPVTMRRISTFCFDGKTPLASLDDALREAATALGLPVLGK